MNVHFRSNCDDRVGRVLRRHYDRPYFLPETSENKNVDWIFMGSPGYGAHMHVSCSLFSLICKYELSTKINFIIQLITK